MTDARILSIREVSPRTGLGGTLGSCLGVESGGCGSGATESGLKLTPPRLSSVRYSTDFICG